MGNYALRIGHSPVPTWRRDMTATNTLYAVGTTPATSGITAAWVYPSGSIPSKWGSVNSERAKWTGFGGAAYVPDIGTYGTWIFNQTGENIWENNAQCWTMSADTPNFEVWTQPAYHVTQAACAAADDDIWYSPTDAANASIVDPSRNFASDSALLAAPWDGVFPMALAGWIWRRKQQKWTLKDNQPHWFRYNTPVVVPPTSAGTSHSVIVCKENNLHGPFAQAWRPSPGYTDAQFHTDVWGSGRVKQYAFWQHAGTKVWSRITDPVPDMSIRDAFSDHAVWDSTTERVYYWAPGNGTYYLDVSGGISSATFSGITATTGSSAAPLFDRGGIGFTDGHPTGKRLIYGRSPTPGSGAGTATHLCMLDLDTNVVYDLDLSGRGLDPGDNWSMQFGYDAPNNRMYITTLGLGTTPRIHAFTIPNDPTSAANYTVSTVELSFASGVSLEADVGHKPCGRGIYHADLGVILITQEDNTMLAFRPEL